MSSIYAGSTVTMRMLFRNPAGQLTDPTTVTLRILPFGGVEESHVYPQVGGDTTIVRDGQGRYTATYLMPAARFVDVRAEAAGAVRAAIERRIQVTPTRFPSP